MREIEFRGKSIIKIGNIKIGEWVYGGISINYDRVWIDTPYYGQVAVNPETIGQYTGLKDKNGKKIFEGDIFSLGDKKILYIVEWIDNGFEGRQSGNSSTVGLTYWNRDIEVIGNIYDNPELLKEEL